MRSRRGRPPPTTPLSPSPPPPSPTPELPVPRDPKPPPPAILDIDGTLIDPNYQHALAWYEAFRQHGVHLPVWRVHRHIGMGGDQLVAALTDSAFDTAHGDAVRAAEAALY